MLAVSMPNSATFAALVETATKCRATDAASPPKAASDQSRALCALVIVSSVVKVFDATMNSVSAGSRSRVASAKSVPSTFETKRKVRSRSRVVPQRLVGHDRPEVGAADADVDDVLDARCRCGPSTGRRGRARQNAAIRSSTAWTPGTTLSPSTRMDAPRGARSAVCRTARSSVTLILSPRNIASMRSRRPRSRASCIRRASVSSVTRCFE